MKKQIFLLGITTLMLVGCGGGDPAPKGPFAITFKDYDNTVLESKMWEANQVPSYNYTVKEDTAEWKYTFKGWSETLNGSVITIPPASKDATYYAVVDQTKQKYTVTFNDEDGNKLTDKSYNYGEIPSYTYTKQNTVEWAYTVKGWSLTKDGALLPSLPSVSGNATYFAVVEKVKQKYTVTFNSNGGTSVSPITQEYNTSVNKPSDPTKSGCTFVSWCTDSSLQNPVSWPLTLSGNQTVYAKWNEKVDIKTYLAALMSATKQDPYSFIPDKMKPSNTLNHVSASDVNYDFSNFNNVNSIKYGGFGEQWQMVIDNIQQSERFYSVLTVADNLLSASVVIFNNWFDQNPSSTNKSIDEEGYFARVEFANNVLSYTIQLKKNITLPLFGEILPQIDMTYNIKTKEKSVRVNLSETNAMKYIVSDNKYVFGIEYGIEALSRNAYCELTRSNNSVEGHIYEYITLKGKDAVKSCADFYIDNNYVSVVGNKASGIILMNNYINELYKTNEGKLLGYKIQETKDIPVVGTATYHTLWFNLNNISGINSVKAIPNGNVDIAGKNTHDIYVNGSTNVFKATYNKLVPIVGPNTSRKYDIEMRTQYRYGMVGDALTCYETKIPMMFIQDDNDKDTNYSDFPTDIKKDNGITASVNLSSTYLNKIRSDYNTLIPKFIQNKDKMNSDAIKNFIGSAVKK